MMTDLGGNSVRHLGRLSCPFVGKMNVHTLTTDRRLHDNFHLVVEAYTFFYFLHLLSHHICCELYV